MGPVLVYALGTAEVGQFGRSLERLMGRVPWTTA
jgi:hypothetical protein